MKLLKLIGNLFGLKKSRQMRLDKLRLKRRQLSVVRQEEKAEKQRRILAQMERYPLQRMTAADFAVVKKQGEINIHNCPLGTWFVYPPHSAFPGIVILGQVVDPLDMFADQWGAGLSLPERGINTYKLELL